MNWRMNIKEQIKTYLQSLPGQKRSDMQALHNLMLQIKPACKLWFLDGKDESGKTVSNPSIGYGFQHLKYADGKTREFYQLGISANTTGITIYIMGIDDKNYLVQTYGKKLGKATVTSYCIKVKALKDINIRVLEDAIRFGFEHQ
jgi:hypothetical protein